MPHSCSHTLALSGHMGTLRVVKCVLSCLSKPLIGHSACLEYPFICNGTSASSFIICQVFLVQQLKLGMEHFHPLEPCPCFIEHERVALCLRCICMVGLLLSFSEVCQPLPFFISLVSPQWGHYQGCILAAVQKQCFSAVVAPLEPYGWVGFLKQYLSLQSVLVQQFLGIGSYSLWVFFSILHDNIWWHLDCHHAWCTPVFGCSAAFYAASFCPCFRIPMGILRSLRRVVFSLLFCNNYNDVLLVVSVCALSRYMTRFTAGSICHAL